MYTFLPHNTCANTPRLLYLGFRNAVRLVQAWLGNQNVPNDPQSNADSNALFASGTWIIVAPGGSPIGPDGSFTKPQATPKARL